MSWSARPLSACIEKVRVPAKVPRKSFLADGPVPIISQEADFINGYWNNADDAVRVSEPLVVFGDHTQVLKLIDFDFVVGADGVKLLKPKQFLDARFLKYFLQANPIPSLGYARHYRHLSRLEVPLPPLDEQKRIVVSLDQAFAALDRARALAEANLADAEELYRSGLDMLLFAHADDWQHGSFTELVGEVSTGPFGSLLHKSDYVKDETPLVNPANIVDGKIEANLTKTVSSEALQRLQSYRLKTGNIVIGRRGEMGRCAAVSAEQDGWLCGTGSFFVRTKPGVSSQLVAHILSTRKLVEQLTAIASGTTMLNLSNTALGKMDFAIPPMERQAKILTAINTLKDTTKRARCIYEGKVTALDDLRKSLLQKAFAGELT